MKDYFFPTLLLPYFVIWKYLNHFKILKITSIYDILYLFKIWILVLQIVKNDEDVIEHNKVMWKKYCFLTYQMYLTYPPSI
jgi:hypothetical protein